MKDISKELLSPGEVGQLDGVEYMAVAVVKGYHECKNCKFDKKRPRGKCAKAVCGHGDQHINFHQLN